MKKIVFCLLILCGLNIDAQGVSVKTAELPAGSVLEADFIQFRYLKGIPKPIKSEGSMVLWDGNGLVWNTISPFPNSILITKKGLYQLQSKIKTPMVKAGGDSAMFDVMAGIFNLKDDGKVRGFKVVEMPSSNSNWRIRLLPLHRQVQNFIASITVEGDTHISHITISRPNGDRDEIDVKKHNVKENIPPEIKVLFI